MARAPSSSMPGLAVAPDGQRIVARNLPEEVPVAMVFDGGTQAVMMATPQHLEDFATGFAVTEGFVSHPDEITELEVVAHENGLEARMWLAKDRSEALKARRRSMMGPVGCGLCGIDSLDQALRDLPVLPDGGLRLGYSDVAGASDALRDHQPLHDQTHAVHAAGFLKAGQGVVISREDVGRHNALDKLIGALLRDGIDPASGAIVLTSRVSVDMVQKTVIAGSPILIAVSAPTALAVRMADETGLTLAAFARGQSFDLYAHPARILDGAAHVA